MIGIVLLLLNNHRKFVDTMKNIAYTSKDVNKAKDQNRKYFNDMYGHKYDINTGRMVNNGYDKFTGHRGIIDVRTGRAVEDHIEMQIASRTDEYINNKFPKIKERLDARKECLTRQHDKKDMLRYCSGKDRYVIYWDNEVKRFVDVNQTHSSYDPNKARELKEKGYSEEMIYEYYTWKGEKINYPIEIAQPIKKYLLR